MDVKVTWSDGLTFTGSGPSGFSLPVGADPSVGGAADGFRPLELLALSLAGCTAMDVIAILTKKQEKVSGFEVVLHGRRQAEHPKVFTEARLLYQVTGRNISEAAVRRAIELSATKYCAAFAMLVKAFPIETVYEIFEQVGEDRELVAQGSYERMPE
jgi:putative redox protein